MMTALDAASLRDWRLARGLSRRAAADILGVNQRTLEDLEYGRSPGSPLWGVLSRLIDALDRISAGPVALER